MSLLGNATATTQTYRIEVTSQLQNRNETLSSQLPSIGIEQRVDVHISDLYFLHGKLTAKALQEITSELICDPVIQSAAIHMVEDKGAPPAPGFHANMHRLEVGFQPGVTDNTASELQRAIQRLGINDVKAVATGRRYDICGELSRAELDRIATSLLMNPVIQRYAIGELQPEFADHAWSLEPPLQFDLRELDDAGLQAINLERRLALDKEGRPATDAELETIAQTWSEHCVHKTFRAQIDCCYEDAPGQGASNPSRPAQIHSILDTYLRAATDAIAAPWVRSAFVDNAGVIEFDQDYDISFKVETHNHPSAIEPFGGANTGVGGVVRDILGVSHRPIANTDVLCFGPADQAEADLPPGVLHPARIRDGVVSGIEDYGNKLGIPTVNGAVHYHPGYTANPLVFCGSVGIGPRDSHPSSPQPGDRILVLGGRTGRDGLRGATFSSQPMDTLTSKVAGSAVQIGDPITEKGLLEVVSRARDAGLYNAVTDCGAGGLSSAVGEMSSRLGAKVDLTKVHLKYAGLAPWEIWLSEAQERMVLAVPPRNIAALVELCDQYWVEHQDIGECTNSGRLQVSYGEIPVIPGEINSAEDLILRLLSHPDIASKEGIVRRYDHLVRGAMILAPLVGPHGDGPSDAAVLKLETEGWRGFVLANGINPGLGRIDPYSMALSVVDEAIRNAVAVGADPQRIAILDNFCWGNPRDPEQLAGLVRAAQGCHDAAIHFGAPFISGKDSLNNEYTGKDGERYAIPGTLLISSIGIHPDVRKAVSMDLKSPGNCIFLVGHWRAALSGSHAVQISGGGFFGQPAALRRTRSLPGEARQTYAALHQAILAGLVRSAHDLSEGGLAVAAAEMALAGRLGVGLDLACVDPNPLLALFAETNGCLLVEVRKEDAPAFTDHFQALPIKRIGSVLAEQSLMATHREAFSVNISMDALLNAFSG